MSEVGRHLALLLAEADPVPAVEVDNALGGRESVLRLLDAIAERGGLGRGGVGVDETPARLAGDPVGLMNSARRAMHRIPDPDAHARLTVEPQSRTGALWLGVHRHAVAAREQVVDAPSAPRIRWWTQDGPLKTWSSVADGAAILGAVVELDRPLVHALRVDGRVVVDQGGEHDTHRWLLAPSAAGVGLAAANVRALAAAGPLPDNEPLRPGVTRPAAVRTRRSQRVGHRRLVGLLREATGLRPEQYRDVLSHHAVTVLAAAHLVREPAHAKLLRDHAASLKPLDVALKRTVSLEPGDQRPVAQAQELARFVRSEVDGTRIEDVGLTVLRALPATSQALADALERDRPTWLVAGGMESHAYLWVHADPMTCQEADALELITAPTTMPVPASDLAMLVLAGAPVPPDTMPGYLADARLIPPRESLAGALPAVPVLERPEHPGRTLTDRVHSATSKAATRSAPPERG